MSILDNFQDCRAICYRIDGANPLLPRVVKTYFHNLCSNSRIRSDACLLTTTATKNGNSIQTNTANGVALFELAGIRYNSAHLT